MTFQQRRGQNLAAVLGGGAVFHQGLASQVKLLEFKQRFAARRPRLELQHCAHARQRRRIQAVGLRQLADRLGEAASLTGIDLDEGNAGRAQGALEGAVIGASRLEDDAPDRRLRAPLHKRLAPTLVVGEATARAVGQAMSVEMIFRDIDANSIVLHLFHAFACHSGLAPGYPCRP